MGSGKTMIGRKLAEALSFSFTDLDDRIEEEAGRSIREIFRLQGELHFRELEQRSLQATHSLQQTIVATGGGTPCFFDNLSWMNQHGLTFYLQVAPEILAQRLQSQTHHRPLLAGKTSEDLIHFIQQKLEARLPYYRQAHITVDAGIPAEELVKRLVQTWKNITGH
jgi:shikimate kinase